MLIIDIDFIGNLHCFVILMLLGYRWALKNEQYQEDKRNPNRGIEDIGTGTLLTCHWPKTEGEVMLSPADKQLLTKDSFETFSKCESLALNNLGIVNMENDVFSTMLALEYLYIRNDKIVIRPDMFDGLNLVSLYLTNMSIISLPDKVFAGLDVLWDLSLANNPLNDLTAKAFYGISNVAWVSLAYSNVAVTPGLFKHIPELLHLDITATPFRFTENMWSGLSLKSLKLGNANVAFLSDELWAGLDPSLEILDLQGNYFETILPHPFQSLTKLLRLDLQNCSITSSDLTARTWTGIGSSLQFLSLHHNHFPNLMAHSFNGLVELRSLDLSFCGIEHINAEALEGLVELDAFYVQGNPLVIMDEEMFGSTSKSPYFYIYFETDCESISCFPGLCWIHEKFKTSMDSGCETSCDNYNITVKQYLENDCK